MMKYYIDPQGIFLGGFDGAPPPDGAVEVSTPPDDGRKVYVNGVWAWPTEIASKLYRAARKQAYLNELGETPGDFVETVGDVLDIVIRELAMRGPSVTPEFSTLLTKITAIKAEFPK